MKPLLLTITLLTLSLNNGYAKLGDSWNHVTRYSRHDWPGGGNASDVGILYSGPERQVRSHNLFNGIVETTERYLDKRCSSIFYSFKGPGGGFRTPSVDEIDYYLHLNGIIGERRIVQQYAWAVGGKERASSIDVTEWVPNGRRLVTFMAYPDKVSQFEVFTFEGWLECHLYSTTAHLPGDRYRVYGL
jgi:hypothetical protein